MCQRPWVREGVKEVEGWGDDITDTGMQFHRPTEAKREQFSNFFTLGPGFKIVRFQAVRLQDSFGRTAQTMQNVCLHKKRFRVDGPSVSWVLPLAGG